MRVAGPSVLNHVSVKNMQSILLPKFKLLITKVVFKRDLMLRSPTFKVTNKILFRDAGIYKTLRLLKFTVTSQ